MARKETKSSSGNGGQAKGIAIVGFIFFLAVFLLKLFGIVAFWGIPIVWIGSFFLLVGALIQSPLMIVAAIAMIAPSYIVDFFVGGALG